MKKYLLILLLILSACSALRKPESTASANQSNSDVILETPQTTVSVKQSNSYVILEKFKGDTLGYVQHNFIDNKQKYIGKDLNTLFNDLEIPIKSFISGYSYNDPTITPHIYLQFYTNAQFHRKIDRQEKPVNIIITWSPPLPRDSTINLLKKNKGEWTDVERKYFGKQIVGDISTTNWDI